jgi:predicted GNAT family acetyltransferase
MLVAHEAAAQRFVARLVAAGPEIGYLEYALSRNKMDLQHTVVNEAGRGKGVGAKLADAACLYAAEQKFTILASCSYLSDKYFLNPPSGWQYDAATKTAQLR